MDRRISRKLCGHWPAAPSKREHDIQGWGAFARYFCSQQRIDELPAPYDPVGRERQRREFADLNNSFVRMRSYDALGQLSATQNLQVVPDTVLPDRTFAYDALGNILSQTDANSGHTGSVSLSYGTTDPDRVCGLAYGTDTAPQAPNCNVTYDGAGNILTMPKRNGGTRTISYFPNGSVSGMADGASNATFSYDAFGSLQQLTINSTLADQRADKYFGAFVKQRIEGAQSVINRRIPLPGGSATRHGPTNNWTFAFSEARGTRFVTDQDGNFVQDIDYQPFGEVRNPSGATPGTTNYENEQWNGGDRLAAFGVVNLGARLYDPVIGRFLSRDPVFDAGNKFNPYAFAGNDPVNQSDPSGMWCISFPTFFCIGNETNGNNTSGPGSGGSGASGGGARSAGGNGNHSNGGQDNSNDGHSPTKNRVGGPPMALPNPLWLSWPSNLPAGPDFGPRDRAGTPNGDGAGPQQPGAVTPPNKSNAAAGGPPSRRSSVEVYPKGQRSIIITQAPSGWVNTEISDDGDIWTVLTSDWSGHGTWERRDEVSGLDTTEFIVRNPDGSYTVTRIITQLDLGKSDTDTSTYEAGQWDWPNRKFQGPDD